MSSPSRRAVPLFMMYRMTRQESSSPVRAPDSRSPFVRLREFLGDIPPGQPAISMAVGEPQHPIPAFVGPVIAAHIEEFGRYPMNKGLDAFAEAVAKFPQNGEGPPIAAGSVVMAAELVLGVAKAVPAGSLASAVA